MSAVQRMADSSRTFRHVRKVPMPTFGNSAGPCRRADAWWSRVLVRSVLPNCRKFLSALQTSNLISICASNAICLCSAQFIGIVFLGEW